MGRLAPGLPALQVLRPPSYEWPPLLGMVPVSFRIQPTQCWACRRAGRFSLVSGRILRRVLERRRVRVHGVLAHHPHPVQGLESAPHPHHHRRRDDGLRNLAVLDACISLCAESKYCCTCLQPIVESCCTCLQPIVFRIRIIQHPIIQCMHYGMSSNTCTCSLTSFLFFVCRIETISWFCNHPLGLLEACFFVFRIDDMQHTHENMCGNRKSSIHPMGPCTHVFVSACNSCGHVIAVPVQAVVRSPCIACVQVTQPAPSNLGQLC